MDLKKAISKTFYVYELWVQGQDHAFYIGKTYEGSRRLQGHLGEATRGGSSLKSRYIRKYAGTLNPVIERVVFRSTTEVEVMRKEAELILNYGRVDLGTGYLTNLTFGWEGLQNSELTEELRDSLYSIGANLRTSFRKRSVSVYGEDGKYLETYPSAMEASLSLGISSSIISKICLGREGRVSGVGDKGVLCQFSHIECPQGITPLTRIPHSSSRSIRKVGLDGTILMTYTSVLAASKEGLDRRSLARAASKGVTYKGFLWVYPS